MLNRRWEMSWVHTVEEVKRGQIKFKPRSEQKDCKSGLHAAWLRVGWSFVFCLYTGNIKSDAVRTHRFSSLSRMARQPILPRRSLFSKNRSLILIFHLLKNQSFRSLQVFQSCRVWILSKYLQGDPLVQGSPLVPEALEDPAVTKRHYYNNARRQPEQEWEYEISGSNMSWDINICDISREKKASIF